MTRAALGNAWARLGEPRHSGNQARRRYDAGALQALHSFISCQPKFLMAVVIAAYASLTNS
jgi:hypothetical protein